MVALCCRHFNSVVDGAVCSRRLAVVGEGVSVEALRTSLLLVFSVSNIIFCLTFTIV
jgi:hypothetical protein